MLLAIDVGNTNTVCGVWDGQSWLAIWRRETNDGATEDVVADWLKGCFESIGLPWRVEKAICGSVVAAEDEKWLRVVKNWLDAPISILKQGADVGLTVNYDPPQAVGADRLANALGALSRFNPPIIVIDFGTATTFDVVDTSGAFAGGAILPGVKISAEALFERAPRLPRVALQAPESAIGRSTVRSLQSGIMLGYAGAIDALAARMLAELGGSAHIIATGGLGSLFVGLCSSIESYDPTLTLDGLVVASRLI